MMTVCSILKTNFPKVFRRLQINPKKFSNNMVCQSKLKIKLKDLVCKLINSHLNKTSDKGFKISLNLVQLLKTL